MERKQKQQNINDQYIKFRDDSYLFKVSDICAMDIYNGYLDIYAFGQTFTNISCNKNGFTENFMNLFYKLNDNTYVKKDRFIYCNYRSSSYDHEYLAHFINGDKTDYIRSTKKFDFSDFNLIK